MNYMHVKRKAICTAKYNLIFVECDMPSELQVDVYSFVADGKSFAVVMGGALALEVAMAAVDALAMQTEIGGTFTVDAVVTVIDQSGIVVNVAGAMDLTIASTILAADGLGSGVGGALEVDVSGNLLTGKNLATTIPIASSLVVNVINVSVEQSFAVDLAIAFAMTVAMAVGTSKPMATSFGGALGITSAATILGTVNFDIEVAGTLGITVATAIVDIQVIKTNIEMANTLTAAVARTRFGLLSDYDSVTLATIDDDTLFDLDYIIL